jgi:hypothetical protein
MGAPQLYFLNRPTNDRTCTCGRKVTHRPIGFDEGIFDTNSDPLFRPVRHCPKCGFVPKRQETTPGDSRIHMNQECKYHEKDKTRGE